MTRYYSSTAQPTTLSAAATDVATTIQVTATTGFPAVEFILALDYGTAQQELVKVTNVAGTTLTVVRGFDSTTAQAHALGAAVRHVHSADDFRLSRTHEAASSGVHGATGALVGTTDAQALSNKDLTAGTNTFPASLATAANLNAHTSATAAHGTTGAVVGATDAQTLTNKTLALGSNTVSGTTAQFNAANTDGDFATLAGTETLTNKTLTSPTINTPTVSSPTATNMTLDGVAVSGKKILTHTADGNRLDAAVAATSNPDGIRLIAGQQTVSFSSGIGTLTFPGTGFAGGVLAFTATTLSGSATAVVVDSGNVTKTTARLVITGLTGSAIISYFALGY